MSDKQLLAAAAKGELKWVKEFVEEGFDVYSVDSLGRNALHLAALHGQKEVMKWLILTMHMDINIADNIGMKAVHYAARNKNEVFPFLNRAILYKDHNSQIDF